MPNGKVHRTVGAIVGFAGVAYLIEGSLGQLSVEIFGGVMGGILGAMMPDIIDRPDCPQHRSIAHGVLPVGIVLFLACRYLMTCRALANDIVYSLANLYIISPELNHVIGQELGYMAAGGVIGFILGYASHLVLDAFTPGSLPIVK